jgi:hypothetical protein
MTTHNANNERIKRRYFTYLKEAMRYSEASVDGVAKALSRFEEMTKYRDFKAFHFEQAVAFKRRLADKAWSQNLGHEKVLTTFINYGQVESSRQGKIIRELADPQPLTNPYVDGLAKALVREMRETASNPSGE